MAYDSSCSRHIREARRQGRECDGAVRGLIEWSDEVPFTLVPRNAQRSDVNYQLSCTV